MRRASGGDIKFCVSNPGLRALVVEHAKRLVKPGTDSVSMDPSDGDHWCQCEFCAAMGGVSNRVLTLANEVAEAIKPVRVGMYAYNKHSAPPSIKVHPGVIVNATTAFIGGRASPEVDAEVRRQLDDPNSFASEFFSAAAGFVGLLKDDRFLRQVPRAALADRLASGDDEA